MADDEEPKIAQKGPYRVELMATYRYGWCACGLSKSQPFCDGSHTSTQDRHQAGRSGPTTRTRPSTCAAASGPASGRSATARTRSSERQATDRGGQRDQGSGASGAGERRGRGRAVGRDARHRDQRPHPVGDPERQEEARHEAAARRDQGGVRRQLEPDPRGALAAARRGAGHHRGPARVPGRAGLEGRISPTSSAPGSRSRAWRCAPRSSRATTRGRRTSSRPTTG